MAEKSGYIGNLIKYIQKNLSKGYTTEALKFALLNQGYSRTEIDKAMKIAQEEMAKKLPPVPEKPVITIETIPEMPEKKTLFSRIKSWFS